MKDPFRLIADVRAECGDVFTLDLLGLGRMVVVCSPQILSELYQMSDDVISAGETRRRFQGALVGQKISATKDGEEYLRWRRVWTPFFNGRRRVHGFVDMIREQTLAGVETWREGETFALQPTLDRIARETVSRILLGSDDSRLIERLGPKAEEFLAAMRSPVVMIPPLQWNLGRASPWGRFVAARQALYDFFGAEIEARQAAAGDREGDAPDVLSAMLRAGLGAGEDGQESLEHELLGLMVAGADTVSKTAAWTIYHVLDNPPIERRLRDELDEGLDGRPLGVDDLARLPYLEAVVNEGLRCQAAIPIAGQRLTRQEVRLAGFTLPAGIMISQALQEVGRSELFPHPDRFDPEGNFLGRRHRVLDWGPFGGGTHVCAGVRLSQVELAVTLGTIFQRWELELRARRVQPEPCGVVFQPTAGLRVAARPR